MVSACLAGIKCKYNGGHNFIPAIASLVKEGKAIPVCPESLGNLPIPRPPAEIENGNGYEVLEGKTRVINNQGQDVTNAFCEGAKATLSKALKIKPKIIILKEKSPSCGSKFIYNGKFNNTIKPGQGVTTALLRKHGFKVISEKDFERGYPLE